MIIIKISIILLMILKKVDIWIVEYMRNILCNIPSISLAYFIFLFFIFLVPPLLCGSCGLNILLVLVSV